jgi:uncharacterized protein (UPF0548 family)
VNAAALSPATVAAFAFSQQLMFFLREPPVVHIRQFILEHATLPFSYEEIGATQRETPVSYNRDHNRIELGQGRDTFERACTALQQWQMFAVDWIKLHPANAPLCPGATVAVLIQHFGFCSLNPCRIVYTIDETTPVNRRFGFAYGTLPGHAERGEERFLIEWQLADDKVWYDLLAFSRPASWLPQLAYPLTRSLQRRFAKASLQAVLAAVQRATPEITS